LLVPDDLEDLFRGLAVSVEDRVKSIQHLGFAGLVATPAGRSVLAYSDINLQSQFRFLVVLGGALEHG
jgi:hypothetical protein